MMLTNEHPHDSLPAFVLGTLDADEALRINAHVIQCPECRAEVETFQAVLSALPYAATPRQPPAHIKQQLLARIAASAPARASASPPRATPRWMQAFAGGTLALSLAFGYMLYDSNSRVTAIGGELAQTRQSIAQMTAQHNTNQTTIAQISDQHEQDQQALVRMQEQIARDQESMTYIAAPQTVHHTLGGSDNRARATMYMQPGNTEAVLVIQGMPRVAPGKTYQLWLAKPGAQVAAETFDVADDGTAMLRIKAPAPLSEYDQAMITIEQAGGASSPSDEIVLSGPLSAAPAGGQSRAD